MSQPVTENWFSLKIRRNRKSFIFANIMLLVVLAVVVIALLFFDVKLRTGKIVFFLFIIPIVIAEYTLTSQRLRDINITGWLALLWIPVAILPDPFSQVASLTFWILLCVIPGTTGENRYGFDPL